MEYLEYIKLAKKIRKILILGSGAVGKTSLTKVLKNEIPLKDTGGCCDYHRTLFVEIEQFKTENDDGTFQLFDLAGQLDLPFHATRDTARFTFSAADLICFVLASDNTQSLIDLNEWVTITKNYYNKAKKETPPFILIKNKVDLENNIDDSLLECIMPNFKAYFEISCYDGKGISELKKWFNEFYTEYDPKK
ncbi:MAG: GTPase domain-containing protein [Candidatus Heimdallarchaeota archaeon]|nr:GTPase domain-containing protein [Candidatus Heimdallarchaeota archaeon]